METPFAGKHVHLVGAGGAGVSALVPLLRRAGATVSGCDCSPSPVTARLQEQGVPVALRHSIEHVSHADIVVHTSAVSEDHLELVAARRAGCRVLGRGACLVELMHGHDLIAVAGSHGKTTTTWMIGHLLIAAGYDPVVMVGGTVGNLGGGGRAGSDPWFVAEVDESDGSFAATEPLVAVMLNCHPEHLDHYGSYQSLVARFNAWLRTVPERGRIILGEEPPDGLLDGVVAPVLRCGVDTGDYHLRDLRHAAEGSIGELVVNGQSRGSLAIPVPGRHMALDALCAVAAAEAVGPVSLASMQRCERVDRRFTVHGQVGGVRVVEDYGHHPVEIQATLAAAALAGGKVHVLFQPHRYTRTRDCFDRFITAFDAATSCAMLPVYAASERPLPGVDSERLVRALAQHRGAMSCRYDGDPAPLIDWLTARAQRGDTILVLGAGDVGEQAPAVLRALTRRAGIPRGESER